MVNDFILKLQAAVVKGWVNELEDGIDPEPNPVYAMDNLSSFRKFFGT